MNDNEEKIKRRNLLLRVAKYGENYYPIRKPSEMKIGAFYRVQSAMIKETKYGQKAALVVLEQLREYIVYIGNCAILFYPQQNH